VLSQPVPTQKCHRYKLASLLDFADFNLFHSKLGHLCIQVVAFGKTALKKVFYTVESMANKTKKNPVFGPPKGNIYMVAEFLTLFLTVVP